jgi:hypothetical protein
MKGLTMFKLIFALLLGFLLSSCAFGQTTTRGRAYVNLLAVDNSTSERVVYSLTDDQIRMTADYWALRAICPKFDHIEWCERQAKLIVRGKAAVAAKKLQVRADWQRHLYIQSMKGLK